MRIINLLPKSEQLLIEKEKVFRKIKNFVVLSMASYLIFGIILFGFQSYVKGTLSNLDSQIKVAQDVISKQDNDSLKKQVDYNNNIITDYNNLYASNPQWSSILVRFSKLVPSGVNLSTFAANTQTGLINISGTAATRDEVLQLHDNIQNSSDFTGIDLPFDNLQKPTKVDFHYTFNLQPNVLIPKK